ncbi:FAD binding domain-containing protein [Thermomonospora echinospora]|uniref:FAD binding domain-containing protein n=1 Tax=Thermomonospora echinospora TaxID=1992 RepID=UPI00190E6B3C|nr:xanthine dehydrogenase family protein subunit M [Thermomonospora echinospora]
MKPAVFSYLDPRTLEEALGALADHGDDASVLAGGQSLVPLLNMRLARPEVVVDVNRVPGLDALRVDAGAVRVGALVRAAAVERDPAVAGALPVLAEAVRHIAHPQIRSRTTIGGNIAHADPSSELPAVLAAVDGAVVLRSAEEERTVGWEEFFVSVFTTAREPEELVTEVVFPVRPELEFRWVEFARHHGDFPVAGVCLGLSLADGAVRQARLAATGVGDRPLRLREVEAALTGSVLGPETAREAGELAGRAVDPPSDVHGSGDFRRAILATLVRRTIESWPGQAQRGRKGAAA